MPNSIERDKSASKRSQARATRAAGLQMRSKLLDVSSRLFKIHGLNGVSITAIAEAADAFPSQITYYFKTKEALFVEAACRDMLHVAKFAEAAGSRARAPNSYMKALVDTIISSDALQPFIEALVLARQKPDLSAQVARTMERLYEDGARAFVAELSHRGWRPIQSPDATSRKFWGLVLGIALQGQGMDKSPAEMSTAVCEALGEMATAD